MSSGLRPCERPGNSAERFNTSLGVALGRSTSNVQGAQFQLRRRLAEVRDETGLLSDQMTISGTADLRHAIHLIPPLLGRLNMLRESLTKHRRGVNVESPLGNGDTAEILRNHFTLLGNTESTVDGIGRVRQNSSIEGRVSATANRTALSMEEGQLNAILLGNLYHLLLSGILCPASGETTGIFGGIGIADHHLLLALALSHVRGDLEQRIDDGRGVG
mmetsp:Transcript_11030/g.25945  ORF Transcript_11030/g.25945 Transcript_11030/m.25945 type:complete len:218 (+) Transcript_11030:428-1081(+)